MKVYFDTCCYCRPFDDRTQPMIDDEAIAVMTAVEMCHIVGYCVIGSDVVVAEIGEIPNEELRNEVNVFFRDSVDSFANITADDIARASQYQKSVKMGIKDSFHLAVAESVGVNVLLTTDKGFIKKASMINTSVKVMNPLKFKL